MTYASTVPRALRATLQDVVPSMTIALLDSSPEVQGLRLAVPALKDGTRIAKISHSACRAYQVDMQRMRVQRSAFLAQEVGLQALKVPDHAPVSQMVIF